MRRVTRARELTEECLRCRAKAGEHCKNYKRQRKAVCRVEVPQEKVSLKELDREVKRYFASDLFDAKAGG